MHVFQMYFQGRMKLFHGRGEGLNENVEHQG